MGRTGESEAETANQQDQAQKNQAYQTGQTAISSGQAALQKLMSGQNIGANPFSSPAYLSNVNKLQADSLDANNNADATQLQQLNKRTGGLNNSATALGIQQMDMQKGRTADALSAQRADQDYLNNIGYQQSLLQDIYQPASLESGYYGTGTQGQDSALGDLTQFGIASYGPWESAIAAAGAAGGGAASGYEQGQCWGAAASFGGWFDPRTRLVRSWINNEFRHTWLGSWVVPLYARYGQRLARAMRRYKPVMWTFRPLFRLALFAACRERRVEISTLRRAEV